MSLSERIAQQNSVAIQEFLGDQGIDMRLLPDDPEARVVAVKRELIDEHAGISMDLANDAQLCDMQQNGLLIIKPEMLPYYERYVEFLESRNIDIRAISEPFCPTHEQWMAQYGDVVAEYPRVIHSYITQRSIGVRVVSFVHNPDIYLTAIDSAGLDHDRSFDQTFCGQADASHPNTLRGDITYTALSGMGFDSMTGYAEPFDIFGYFHRGSSSPLRTYNGVHIPGDRTEKENNYAMYGSAIG